MVLLVSFAYVIYCQRYDTSVSNVSVWFWIFLLDKTTFHHTKKLRSPFFFCAVLVVYVNERHVHNLKSCRDSWDILEFPSEGKSLKGF